MHAYTNTRAREHSWALGIRVSRVQGSCSIHTLMADMRHLPDAGISDLISDLALASISQMLKDTTPPPGQRFYDRVRMTGLLHQICIVPASLLSSRIQVGMDPICRTRIYDSASMFRTCSVSKYTGHGWVEHLLREHTVPLTSLKSSIADPGGAAHSWRSLHRHLHERPRGIDVPCLPRNGPHKFRQHCDYEYSSE